MEGIADRGDHLFEALTDAIAARITEQIKDAVREEVAAASSTEGYIGVEKAADYMDRTPKRVRNLTNSNRLRHVKDGALTLTKHSWIDQYLEENRNEF